MKRKDFVFLLVVVFVSAVFSLLVSKLIFGSSQDRQETVEVVQPITANFPKPDKHYFNKDSFDPTKQITIGQNINPDPFSGSGTPR